MKVKLLCTEPTALLLINVCYKRQQLTDHVIFRTNTVAAELRSHPLLNASCVGMTWPLQLSGSLSEQFNMTTWLPTTTSQPDRSNIDFYP